MKHQPPRLARRVFEFFSGAANIDDLLGDLDEWFYLNIKHKSPFRAKVWYWKQVLSLCFSYALKKRKRDARFGTYASSTISFDMLKSYLKVAIRNLYQHKYFAVLNAFGLAIGMSISLLLISLYSYIITYDDFQVNKEHIYTIISTRTEGVEEIEYATSPIVLAEKLKEDFPGAQTVVRIYRDYNSAIKTEKENIPVKCYYVDPEFLSVFTYEMLQGSAAALHKPNQVLLTESAASKLFNSLDVVGKTLELEGGGIVEIAGLMKQPPQNSHLNFEMLVSYSSLPPNTLSIQDQWTNYQSHYVYVLLRDDNALSDLEEFLNGVSLKTYAEYPVKISFATQHLQDIPMGPDLRQAIGPKWEASGMWVFAILAILILLPACFNYTNISIARALKRSKEIGLRKTMGGVKNQIFFQFITETVVVTLLSLLGALFIFVLIRSEFQSMLVSGSLVDLSLTWKMVGMFVLFALFTGITAGIFPAFYFSGLNPIQALKNKINTRGSSMRLRKGLTIFQFTLSFGFILALVVFSRLYQYSINFDFGFEKNNIVDVELRDVDPTLFKTAFSQLASVKSVSMSSGLLGIGAPTIWIHNSEADSTEVAQLFVDSHFINNFKLTFLVGKNFPDEPWQRERYIIVNEEFLKEYKINNPADALGKVYTVDGADLEVIGVLKNFHFSSLRYPITKFFFRMNPKEYVYANLQVTSTDAFSLFTQMENTWKQLPTQKKFEGKFFEDQLNEAYHTYKVLLKIVGFLGLLAITISLLGMLGMVVYTAESKTKEVSIRKVMGASISSIAFLLSKDYLKMMAWAILFAIPLSIFLFNALLTRIQHYSVQLNVWDILLSAGILLVLGIVTITSQTYKTATTNPADTLRVE